MSLRKRLLLASGVIALLALGWAVLGPPTGLEARVFSTTSDREFFERWLKIQVNVELRPMSRSLLINWRTSRLVSFPDQTPFLAVPKDLRLREVPCVVLDLERHVYGEDLPAFATSRTLAEAFEIALRVRRERIRTASMFTRWWELRRIQELETWRGVTAAWRPLGQAELGLDDRPLPAALNRLREGLPRRFPDSEQQARLRRFLDAVQSRPGDLDHLLARELEEALPFATFQVGAQRLARYLECFTQPDLQDFRRHRKTIRTDPKDLPVQGQPLWRKLGIPERALNLDQARQGGDLTHLAALELDAMKALQAAVAQFPWSEEGNDASFGSPALMLTTKELRCVGMSVVIHACLRSLGIAHDGLGLPRHVAILARTADGREWVMDATDGPAPKEAPVHLPLGRNTPAQGLGYSDHVCRIPAERLLAAAILWNQTNEHTHETPGRLHPWRQRFFAWNPEDLNALQSFYGRQTQAREARSWLDRILKQTPNDPAANLDLWALERDRGRKKEALAAWEKAMKGEN